MAKRKIVIISNYYPPEMGAAANRIKNMAEGLRDQGNEVIVICPIPNYPMGSIFKEYKGKFRIDEKSNGIVIKRYWIFPSISKNIVVRFFSMISFASAMWLSLFWLLKNKPNLFIIQSPPLFVALSGLVLSKVVKSKNVLNVSDLWPLSAVELGIMKKGIFYALLEKIETLNYRLSDKIIGQSEETISHIKKRIDRESLVYRNVPFYKEFPTKQKKETLRIVYAGLLGYAQGLLNICKQVNFKELNVELHIYGSGMEEEEIVDFIKNNETTVFFHGRMDADKIKEEILKYDVALVSLVTKIYGALPSKIFELMQLRIPILYSGEGEGAVIIMHEEIGLCSHSNDFLSLTENIITFKNMSVNSYNRLTKNCFNSHLKKYNLEIELAKLKYFIK